MGTPEDSVFAATLADAIGSVRAELMVARERGIDAPVRFELGAIEMEFELGFVRTAGADGGFRFGVVSLGAKGELSHLTTHRLKVELHPQDPLGNPIDVSDVDTE